MALPENGRVPRPARVRTRRRIRSAGLFAVAVCGVVALLSGMLAWADADAGQAAAYTCPCTLFGSTVPPVPDSGDAGANVELGVKFTADTSGSVSGVRFYKSALNAGTHTGSLWSASGTRLATGTFTAETGTGWQDLTFAAPVGLTAGLTYVASYHTTTGHYASTHQGFAAAVDNAPLHAPASTASSGNGVYRYGASAFPNLTYLASNYWVDVTLALPTSPPTSTTSAPTTTTTTTTTTSTTTTTVPPTSTTTTSAPPSTTTSVPSGGANWDSVARSDGSPVLVFGMQEASGTSVHDAVSGGAIAGSVVGGGMTFGTPGPGTRTAVHSTGTGFLSVPADPQYQLSGTTASYEVILKSDLAHPTDWMTVQDFATPANGLSLHGYAMYANGGGGPNTANIELFTNNQDGYHGIVRGFPITWDTAWHDWVWVLDVANGQSRLRLYRDGVSIGGPVSLGRLYTLSPNTNPMVLFGAWNAATTTAQDWRGAIAGFAVYASPLSQAQVTARYNAISAP